jgi:hypothetical protein
MVAELRVSPMETAQTVGQGEYPRNPLGVWVRCSDSEQQVLGSNPTA